MTYARVLWEEKGGDNGRETFGLSGCAAEGYKKRCSLF
jgi:hypothetical protein